MPDGLRLLGVYAVGVVLRFFLRGSLRFLVVYLSVRRW